MSYKIILLASLLLSFDTTSSSSAQGEPRLEESVTATPAGPYLVSLKNYLAELGSVPASLREAATQIVNTPSGLFHDDILMAAKKASQIACSPHTVNFSNRAKAMIFVEQFTLELYKGKIRRLVNQHVGKLDTETLFAEFYDLYLDKYIAAWGMRDGKSQLYQQCKAYGVNSLPACMQALLVFGATQKTTCRVQLEDLMFSALSQPALPDDDAK